jgi:hypothetical protein
LCANVRESETESTDVSTLSNSKIRSNEDDVVALLDNSKDPASVALALASVWDDRYVETVAINGGKQRWKCGWCGLIFKTQHVTRII